MIFIILNSNLKDNKNHLLHLAFHKFLIVKTYYFVEIIRFIILFNQ